MRASELILKLQREIENYGDLPVGFYNLEYGDYENVAYVGVQTDSNLMGLYNGSDFIGID